jgi:hypothetical protein
MTISMNGGCPLTAARNMIAALRANPCDRQSSHARHQSHRPSHGEIRRFESSGSRARPPGHRPAGIACPSPPDHSRTRGAATAGKASRPDPRRLPAGACPADPPRNHPDRRRFHVSARQESVARDVPARGARRSGGTAAPGGRPALEPDPHVARRHRFRARARARAAKLSHNSRGRRVAGRRPSRGGPPPSESPEGSAAARHADSSLRKCRAGPGGGSARLSGGSPRRVSRGGRRTRRTGRGRRGGGRSRRAACRAAAAPRPTGPCRG